MIRTMIRLFSGLLLAASLFAAEGQGAKLKVPSQYPTIGAAIAAAGAGDIVLVSPGTYAENLMISAVNDLTIQGVKKGTEKVIVDGSLVTRVTVRKCKVQDATANGIWVHGDGIGAKVESCKVKDCYIGISIEDDYSYVLRNKVTRSAAAGIQIFGASKCVIEKNKVTDGGANGVTGINLGSFSLMSTLHANTVSGGMQMGLRSSDTCLRTVMSDNKVTGTTGWGIRAAGDGNFVTRNTVLNSGDVGIAAMSADGIFADNEISDSGGHGLFVNDGADTATNNVLRGNTVLNAGGDGIHVDDDGNVLIANKSKKSAGVDLDYADAAGTTVLFDNNVKTTLP